MIARVISGREVAEKILSNDLRSRVEKLKDKNIVPKLVVILVGEVKASASYVAQKEKFAGKAGIESEVRRFEDSISEQEILSYGFVSALAKSVKKGNASVPNSK